MKQEIVKTMMTGMLMARLTGGKSEDGRALVMLFGVVAVPADMKLKEGHQYVVSGGSGGLMHMNVDAPIDRSREAYGASPSNLLCSPIWRV